MRLAVIEPTPFGGLLHYATQMADALAERGNDVDLIVTRDQELAGRTGPAHRRPILASGAGPASKAPALVRRARTAGRLTATWTRIMHETRGGGYDAVLLNGSFDLALTAAGARAVTATRGSTRVAHVCHNVRPFNRWGGDDLFVQSGPTMELLKRAYPSFDLLFVHGEKSLRDYHETWPAARVEVIPHGDERLFATTPPPPSDEPRILFFGAWRKMKGLDVLMEAFDALSAQHPEVRLTIAGPTVPEEGVAERVTHWARQRADRVELVPGYVAIDDVPALFARARVVVMPYLAGYQSGVVHLAMTMRRAIVASDVGDLTSSVLDERTGLVVTPGAPDELRDALARVVTDPALAQRLGAAGHDRVRTGSDWPSVAARVETALRSLTDDRTSKEFS